MTRKRPRGASAGAREARRAGQASPLPRLRARTHLHAPAAAAAARLTGALIGGAGIQAPLAAPRRMAGTCSLAHPPSRPHGEPNPSLPIQKAGSGANQSEKRRCGAVRNPMDLRISLPGPDPEQDCRPPWLALGVQIRMIGLAGPFAPPSFLLVQTQDSYRYVTPESCQKGYPLQ